MSPRCGIVPRCPSEVSLRCSKGPVALGVFGVRRETYTSPRDLATGSSVELDKGSWQDTSMNGTTEYDRDTSAMAYCKVLVSHSRSRGKLFLVIPISEYLRRPKH